MKASLINDNVADHVRSEAPQPQPFEKDLDIEKNVLRFPRDI
jgi:hypothetical protein